MRRGLQRIRVAVDAFGVHVDQPHVGGRQRRMHARRVVKVVEALLAIGQPLGLCSPVDVLLRVPDILSPKGKSEGLQAHGFIGDIAGQNDQVCPGNLVPVLLLNRPQQPPRLVQIDVIRPRVQRRKALVARPSATATIRQPVGACGMPSHADHQPAIVAPIGWPPVLAVRHQRRQVLLQRLDIELFQFVSVVEVRPHGVRLLIVLMQDVQVECVGPPTGDGGLGAGHSAMCERAPARGLRFNAVHSSLPRVSRCGSATLVAPGRVMLPPNE